MYGKAPTKETVYSLFVLHQVTNALLKGEGCYDVKELAFACGLKPTHNFKRRIMQLVAQRHIRMNASYTENGRLKAVFYLPEVDTSDEQPF